MTEDRLVHPDYGKPYRPNLGQPKSVRERIAFTMIEAFAVVGVKPTWTQVYELVDDFLAELSFRMTTDDRR